MADLNLTCSETQFLVKRDASFAMLLLLSLTFRVCLRIQRDDWNKHNYLADRLMKRQKISICRLNSLLEVWIFDTEKQPNWEFSRISCLHFPVPRFGFRPFDWSFTNEAQTKVTTKKPRTEVKYQVFTSRSTLNVVFWIGCVLFHQV